MYHFTFFKFLCIVAYKKMYILVYSPIYYIIEQYTCSTGITWFKKCYFLKVANIYFDVSFVIISLKLSSCQGSVVYSK